MQAGFTRRMKSLTLAQTIGVVAAVALMFIVACSQDSGEQQRRDGAPTKQGDEAEKAPCPTVDEADRQKVVAQVGDVEITVCDVTEALNKMSPYLRKAYNDPQKRQQFLDNLIRFELIAQEAESRGYADDPEVQRVRKQMMIQRLNKQLQESVRLRDITEEDIRTYYEQNEGDYHKAKMVRIARILVKTKAEAQKVLTLAKSKSGDSRYFRQLAREHSIDEKTRKHGGDMPYFPRVEDRREDDPEIDEVLVNAAFELEMREPLLGKAIETSEGWNVIRLRGKRKARDLSFDDVKRQIRHRLHREKLREVRDELLAKLRKNAKIAINEPELNKIRIELPSDAPSREGPPVGAPAGEKAPTGAQKVPPSAQKALPGAQKAPPAKRPPAKSGPAKVSPAKAPPAKAPPAKASSPALPQKSDG